MTKNGVSSPADLPSAFRGLGGLAERIAAFEAELAQIRGGIDDRTIQNTLRKLGRQLREFEPSVTMIGQVKAGKTTLVNAMVGWPDLLPADVNPWTSVVTSLHMQPHAPDDERRASFRFFSNEEWDHLIRQGGRVGEMANRAGAADELEKVRKQLDEIREKSRERLGRRFQMLLGQSHDYDQFDEGLIQRYVCLGDDFWDAGDGSREQGRFADITKSADLWFARPDLPVNLCIQDTPGVNDTFMIREQITINALRGSRLCVMVLSAQQALSSVDLGLIRLISNVKSRDVIIFVNRIDELADPAREVPAIRDSIRATLQTFEGPQDAQIIFGSGYWAQHAVAGTFDQLGDDSAQALLSWAEAELDDTLPGMSPVEAIWTLSGLPALGDAIAERIDRSDGAKLIERVETALGNLRAHLVAYESVSAFDGQEVHRCALSPADMVGRFQDIERRAVSDLEARLAQTQKTFHARIENAHQTFLGRATTSLIKHLEDKGDGEIWTYDPAGLRMLLRSAYQVFVRGASKAGAEVYGATADEISTLFQAAFDVPDGAPRLAAPPVPQASPPVALGQTIALDMRGSWWTRFWRRQRGYQAFFDDFSKLIYEETVPVVSALQSQNADLYAQGLIDDLRDFIATQHEVLVRLSELHDARSEPPEAPFRVLG